ncbi:MAG TPA: transglutaminase domain-containing protein [Candidatus Hydromicrobium sp.]
MTGSKKTITKIIIIIILLFIIPVLNLTSCRNRSDEEFIDSGVFTGIPNSYLISKINVPGQAIDVNTSGNYAYLTNDLGVLYVIDIQDKENPVIIGKCPGVESANIVIIKDNYAYISYTEWIRDDNAEVYTNCGFYIVDIQEKENPELIGNYNTGENNNKSAYGLFIEGDYAYINTVVEKESWEISRLEIVDISEKRNPKMVSAYEIDGLPSSIWVEKGLAYININFYDYEKRENMDDSRLLVLNIEEKNSPEIINSCKISSNSWGLYVLGNYAYISSCKRDEDSENYTESILQIVDIGDLSNLKTPGKCEIPGGAWELDSAGGYIYISSLSGGIYAIDVKDSNNPVIADSLNTNGTSYDITIEGNYGYIADGFEGMGIVELSGQSVEKEKLYTGGSQDTNLPPRAFIEITGDRLTGGYFQIKNPVYFSARKAFDPDGDELDYLWEVNGTKYSDEKSFSYYFDKPGEYKIKLAVSDGVESSEATHNIVITEMNLPITSSIRHDFKVEINYTLINNSIESLKDINCFMRVPQTYYPFQIINDYSPNISNSDELFDNNWNSLIHFQIDNELPAGESLTVSVVMDITLYEFDYRDLDSDNLSYDKNDRDLETYTADDLFIDSDNPEIYNTAKSLIKNEIRPIEIARILYNFVIRNLYYDFPRAEDKDYEFLYSSEILERGKGVCSDYAILYTALLRSAGIPARLAAGIPAYAILYEKEKEIDMGHAWVEIKLPGYGWIPIDITPEEDFMSANYYLDIATEKGSGYLYENKTMDWGSYYYDGFLFSWNGNEVPEIEQEFIFRVIDLDLQDIMLD